MAIRLESQLDVQLATTSGCRAAQHANLMYLEPQWWQEWWLGPHSSLRYSDCGKDKQIMLYRYRYRYSMGTGIRLRTP